MLYRFGPFELDLDAFELRRGGKRVEIARKPFDALAFLARNPGRIVGQDELVAEVWGVTHRSASTVPTTIAAIRRALDDDPDDPSFVETVRGRGYRFLVEPELLDVPVTSPAPRAVAAPPASERSRFVGREHELELLAGAMRHAASGKAQLVLAVGEPGIGKTRLLEELGPLGRESGAECAVARCREDEGAPALWPWVQVLRGCASGDAASGEAPLVPRLLEEIDPELRVEGIDPSRLTPRDADEARFLLFDAVSAFLRREAERRPLALLFDDLHRADIASLRLLRFAWEELRDAPILFFGTYRDVGVEGDAQRSRPQLSALGREEGARTLPLGGLSRDDVKALVEAHGFASGDSRGLADDLHDRSGGNPFFVTQLIHLLQDRGSDDADLPAVLDDALPRGLRDVFLRQLDGLPDASVALLEAAAVTGREFSVGLLAAALELPPERVLEDLAPAIERRIVRPEPDVPGRHRFAHLLLRDALYERLGDARSTRLHLRIGRALADAHAADPGPASAELAHHFFQAAHLGGAAEAVHYATRAAEWANERLSYEEAPVYYQKALRALELTSEPSERERCALLIALGQSELRAEERARGRETLKRASQLAQRIGEPELVAQAALGLAPGPLSIEVGVVDPLLVSMLEQALEAVGSSNEILRTQLLARLSLALVWGDDDPRRLRLSREALEGARGVDAPETRADALMAHYRAIAGPEHLEERLKIAEEIGDLASRSRSRTLDFMHRILRITGLLERGDVAPLERELALHREQAASFRQPYYSWYTPLYGAMRALMTGHFDEAARLADEFHAIGRRVNDTNAIQSFGGHRAIVLREQGRAADAARLVEVFIERFPSTKVWHCAHAFLLFEAGDPDAARLAYERIAREGFENLPRNELWTVMLVTGAMAGSWLGDQRRAETLHPLLLPGEDQYCVLGFGVMSFGSIALYLAMLEATLERWDAAERHFAHAHQQNARLGAIPFVAYGHFERARALAQRGRAQDLRAARREAREAVRVARGLGMRTLERKAARIAG